MPDRCPLCGELHDGGCPQPGEDDAGSVEVCAFCGVAHPRQYKCGQWARMTAGEAGAPWVAEERAALPPLPSVKIEPHVEKQRANPWDSLVLRIVLVVLALVGALQLAFFAFDRLAGSTGPTSAALPACSRDRIQRNLLTASTIASEANSQRTRRMDQTNRLLLGSSDECSEQLLTLYTAYIDYQTLCLQGGAQAACANRDAAHAALNDALASP